MLLKVLQLLGGCLLELLPMQRMARHAHARALTLLRRAKAWGWLPLGAHSLHQLRHARWPLLHKLG